MGDGYLLEQRQEYDLLRIERRLPRTRGLEACLCVCGLVCLFVSSRSFCAAVERGPTLAFGVRWSLDSTEEAISRKKEGFFTALVLVKLAASSSLSSDSWWGNPIIEIDCGFKTHNLLGQTFSESLSSSRSLISASSISISASCL